MTNRLIYKKALCEICKTKIIPDDGIKHCCTICVRSKGERHGKFCDKTFKAIKKLGRSNVSTSVSSSESLDQRIIDHVIGGVEDPEVNEIINELVHPRPRTDL